MRRIVLIRSASALFGLMELPGVAVVAVAAAVSLAQSQQQKPAPVRVSSEELRRVSRVMTHFRQAGKDEAKRQAVVREAIVAGTPAVSALKDRLWRELAPELKHYLVKFKPEAARYVRDRVAKTDFKRLADCERRCSICKSNPPSPTKRLWPKPIRP